jgi:hypothetical protein
MESWNNFHEDYLVGEFLDRSADPYPAHSVRLEIARAARTEDGIDRNFLAKWDVGYSPMKLFAGLCHANYGS